MPMPQGGGKVAFDSQKLSTYVARINAASVQLQQNIRKLQAVEKNCPLDAQVELYPRAFENALHDTEEWIIKAERQVEDLCRRVRREKASA